MAKTTEISSKEKTNSRMNYEKKMIYEKNT